MLCLRVLTLSWRRIVLHAQWALPNPMHHVIDTVIQEADVIYRSVSGFEMF